MDDIKQQLETKEKELADLKDKRSEANCVSTHGASPSHIRIEMEIEELEDEIAALKKKLEST